MTLHMAWTITGTVDDIYRPGAITAGADDVRAVADRATWRPAPRAST